MIVGRPESSVARGHVLVAMHGRTLVGMRAVDLGRLGGIIIDGGVWLKRIDGMWRLGTGKGRRRDVDEAPAENVENVEVNEGEEFQQDFDWEQVEKDARNSGEE
ncbi:hypothetical protein Dimus_018409 [Dionaea muscipula]